MIRKIGEFYFEVPGEPRPRLEPTLGVRYIGKKRIPQAVERPENAKYREAILAGVQEWFFKIPDSDPVHQILRRGLWSGPVSVDALWTFPRDEKNPTSTLHLGKPDEDNLLKMLYDGLKGVVFHDDTLPQGGKRRKMRGDIVRTQCRINFLLEMESI